MDAHLLKKKATPRESKGAGISGRPPKNTQAGELRTMYWDGELHKLVVERLPEFVVGGRISMKLLAKATGHCTYTLYKAFTGDKISVGVALAMLTVSDSKTRPPEQGLTMMDLAPFVLK